MLEIIKMTNMGKENNSTIMYFDFTFGSINELPNIVYALGNVTYIIADNSTAINRNNRTLYRYSKNSGKWNKVVSKDKPVIPNSDYIDSDGIHNIPNNEIHGFRTLDINATPQGTFDYNQLTNKPTINDVELIGNLTTENLGLQETLTFDSTPLENSLNPVTSDGIYQALANKTEEYDAGKTVPKGTTVTYRGQPYTVNANAEIFNNYNNNIATGMYSHAEGVSTAATGYQAHAEGAGTWASGMGAHAEGGGSVASGANSHAEGASREASGSCSHAEGGGTLASGSCSHAEGGGTVAIGVNSHAEGASTIASSDYQHAEGKWNVEDSNNKFAHIIGNGTANNARSNAYAVDWDGKIYTHNSATGFDINSNYLEMPNNVRLYIATTEPTGTIPEGSLGMGWAGNTLKIYTNEAWT